MNNSRRLYETPSDLAAERVVIERLNARWSCAAFKLPIAYRLDYALVDGKHIAAWAEIKCRGAKYEEMHLSLHKWMAGLELSRSTHRPFILVYAFGDEVFWRSVENDKPNIVIGGRTDRTDWQDTEPMAVFPLKDFKRL